MRLLATIAALALCIAPAARAQSPSEPSLAFTISGGMSQGGPLWTIDRQPLSAPGGPPPAFDTVTIGRKLRNGVSASLAVSLYRSPRFGINAEVGYFGVGSEQRCSGPPQYAPDSLNINQQACERGNGQHVATSLVAFLAGGTYRFLPGSRVQPFVRANAGLAFLSNAFVETSGLVAYPQCSPVSNVCLYNMIAEKNRPSMTWVVSLAGGFSAWLGAGYRIRMEARDLMTSLPVVNSTTMTPTGLVAEGRMTVKHVPVYMIGLDVLLESRHPRRY